MHTLAVCIRYAFFVILRHYFLFSVVWPFSAVHVCTNNNVLYQPKKVNRPWLRQLELLQDENTVLLGPHTQVKSGPSDVKLCLRCGFHSHCSFLKCSPLPSLDNSTWLLIKQCWLQSRLPTPFCTYSCTGRLRWSDCTSPTNTLPPFLLSLSNCGDVISHCTEVQ